MLYGWISKLIIIFSLNLCFTIEIQWDSGACVEGGFESRLTCGFASCSFHTSLTEIIGPLLPTPWCPRLYLSSLSSLLAWLLLVSIRSSGQVGLVKGEVMSHQNPSPVWRPGCACGELGLSVSCGAPGKGIMTVLLHQANSAMIYLSGSLTGASHLPPFKYHTCLWAEALIPWGCLLVVNWGSGYGKGRLISPSLVGALDFLFELGLTNDIAGPVYKIVWCTNSLKGLQPEDSLGISSRVWFEFSFYRLLSEGHQIFELHYRSLSTYYCSLFTVM